METGFGKWIDALKTIPPFKEEVEQLQLKYKTYPHHSGRQDALYYKEQSDYLVNFQIEVNALDKKIRDWLKNEYEEEVNDKALFWVEGYYPYGGTPVENYGLDKWITKMIRPADHGGYPGAQWGYDTSIPGQITKLCFALQQAYWKCSTKHEETRKKQKEDEAKQKAARERQEKTMNDKYNRNWDHNQKNKESYQKRDALSLLQNALLLITPDYKPVYDKAAKKKAFNYLLGMFGSEERANEWLEETEGAAKNFIDSLVKRWVPLLIDSMSMHWFPERVEKGIRRPGEWKADFNLEVVARMEYQCGKLIGYRIKENAWKQSVDKRELLSLFHEKVKA